jgi:hypothetical protein
MTPRLIKEQKTPYISHLSLHIKKLEEAQNKFKKSEKENINSYSMK